MRYLSLLPILLLCLCGNVNAQDCGCTNCPQDMPDQFQGDFYLTVTGADSNDLSSPNQGICGIELNFVHEYVGDLEIILISPSKDTLTLVGPIGISGNTDNSSWDVSFVRCADVAVPDPGISAVWNNAEFLIDGTYSGTYYPAVGCLEDIDSGSVNGTWTLSINDAQFRDTGVLIDYNIIFCNDTGITCLSCNTTPSEIDSSIGVSACEGDPSLNINVNPVYLQTNMDSADYRYTYVLGQADTIYQYLTTTDFTSFPPGQYNLHGLQYHMDNENILPPVGSVISQLKADIENDVSFFCGRFSNDNISIEIFEVPDTNFMTEEICRGGVFVVNGNPYINTGIYTENTLTDNGCDSVIVLDLTVLEHPVFDTAVTICEGDSYIVGDSIFTTTGNYSVRLFGAAASGCDSIVNVDLSVYTVDIFIELPDTLNCVNPNIFLDGRLSQHGPNVTFLWEFLGVGNGIVSGSTTKRARVRRAGQYSFTIVQRDGNGNTACTVVDTVSVFRDTLVPEADGGNDLELNCSNERVEIDGSNSSQYVNLIYEWTGPGIDTNVLVFETAQVGTYILTVRDTVNGCVAEDTVVVTENFTTPTSGGTSTVINCNVDSSIMLANIQINATFNWTGPNGYFRQGEIVTTRVAGNYQLEVIGANGCRDTSIVSVSENLIPPGIGIIPARLSCNTNTGTHSALSNPGVSYQWQNESGAVLSNVSTLTVSDTNLYFVFVTDIVNGCVSVDSVRALVNFGVPSVNVDTPAVLNCDSTSVRIRGSVGDPTNLQWEWADTTGNVISNMLYSNVNEPGVYTFRVTDIQNGCETTIDVNVLQDTTSPDFILTTPDTITCVVSDVQLEATYAGGLPYSTEWFSPAGSPISNTELALTNSIGQHRIEVMDTTNGCTTVRALTVVADTSLPIAAIMPADTLTCIDQSIGLSVVAENGIIYNWYDSTNLIQNSATQVNVSEAGVYVLEAINPNSGCTSFDSIEVAINVTPPNVNAVVSDTLSCDVVQVLLSTFPTVVAAYKYEWSQGGTYFSGNAQVFTGTPGEYTLLCTDVRNGCSTTDTVMVLQDTVAPVASIMGVEELDCVTDTISLDASVSGGNNDLVFTWQLPGGGSASGDNISVFEPGTYRLTVLDTTNGCHALTTEEVTQNIVIPTAAIGGDRILNCIDTVAMLNSQGSSTGATIEYLWFNSQTVAIGNQPETSVSTAGPYLLLVTDTENGCTNTATATVTQDTISPTIIVPLAHAPTLTCNRPSFELDGSNSQPTGNLAFEWTLPSNTTDNNDLINVSSEGTYKLLLTNIINGCTENYELEVTLDNLTPTATTTTPDTLTCVLTETPILATPDSFDSALRYSWTSPGGQQFFNVDNISADEGGDYRLSVVNDRTGCDYELTVTVPQDTASPMVQLQADEQLTCSVEEVLVKSEGSSLGSNYTYNWSSLSGGNIIGDTDGTEIIATSAAPYTLSIIDNDNGCVNSKVITVREETDVPRSAVIQTKSPTCDVIRDGLISVQSVVGGITPYNYFFNGNGPLFDPVSNTQLPEGTYTIGIEDANGCYWDTVITLVEPEPLSADLGAALEIEKGEVVELSLTTNKDYSTAEWIIPFDLNCDPSNGICFDTPEVSLTYLVVVTDSNGCTAEASKSVTVKTVRRVFAPTVFSPNGDSNNDFFFLTQGRGTKQINKMMVTDRWGELLYSFDLSDTIVGANTGWDGSFNGEMMPPGVYIYMAEVEYEDGETEILKGSVTLVR